MFRSSYFFLIVLLVLLLGCTAEDADEKKAGDLDDADAAADADASGNDDSLSGDSADQTNAEVASVLNDFGVTDVTLLGPEDIEEITTVVNSPSFTTGQMMPSNAAADALIYGNGGNFAMLLTDNPLEDQGVEKVLITVKRVELIRAGFEGLRFEEEKFKDSSDDEDDIAEAEDGEDDAEDESDDLDDDEDESDDPEDEEDESGEKDDETDDDDFYFLTKEDETGDEDAGTGTTVDDTDVDETDAVSDDDESEDKKKPTARIIISETEQVFDLLSLQNDVTAVLGGGTIPVGRYSQIRLVLAEENSIVVGGKTLPLKIPSGSNSGLKIKGKFEVKDGEAFVLTLDFDAAKSIVVNGKGEYKLKPVIKIKSLDKAEKDNEHEGKSILRRHDIEGDTVDEDSSGDFSDDNGRETGEMKKGDGNADDQADGEKDADDEDASEDDDDQRGSDKSGPGKGANSAVNRDEDDDPVDNIET